MVIVQRQDVILGVQGKDDGGGIGVVVEKVVSGSRILQLLVKYIRLSRLFFWIRCGCERRGIVKDGLKVWVVDNCYGVFLRKSGEVGGGYVGGVLGAWLWVCQFGVIMGYVSGCGVGQRSLEFERQVWVGGIYLFFVGVEIV